MMRLTMGGIPMLGIPMLLLLAACSSSPSPTPAPKPPPMTAASGDATCDASTLTGHVGDSYESTQQEALASQSGAKRVRVIHAGDGYTMDYQPARLNVHLDEQGRIDRLNCG